MGQLRGLRTVLPAVLLAGACGWVATLGASAGATTGSGNCASGPERIGRTIVGTPCADVIYAPASVTTVEGGAGNDTIIAAPIAATEGCESGCPLGVGSQTFEGGPGNDVVFGQRGNDILRGGEGNDRLYGGIGDDLLEGGPGNDLLAGGFGADSIDGQQGSDFVRGDSTIDRIYDTGGGESGETDTLSYATGVTPGFGDELKVTGFPPKDGERGVELELGATGQNADNGVAPLGGGVDEVEVGAFETIVGTPFSDHIVGTERAEKIFGGGGADDIEGGGGEDQIYGGADGDLCQGDPSPVECESQVKPREPGKVSVGFMTPPAAALPYSELYLVGSNGNDKIAATYSPAGVAFELTGTSFDESASDAGGCEIETAIKALCPLSESAPLDSLLLAGMNGNDTIVAGNFPATVAVVGIGGEGNDAITGGEQSEEILVDGPGEGEDVLSGLGGDEALTHNGGADKLLGGDGNDLFLSNSVCDGEQIVGGAGRDNASWARFGEGIEANLTTGVAGRPGTGDMPNCGGEPVDSISEVEDLEGSSYGDVLYGDGGPNQLLGHPGPDAFFAGGGEDSILANSGDADLVINCGPDVDSATIDHPQYGDPAPIECENVYEADPNNFRTRTLLPPPPLPEPPPPPPDVTPPQTRITSHPKRTVVTRKRTRRVAFRFSASEPAVRFRCKLDRKPYRACTSPRSYRVVLGPHAFRVAAIDPSGNVDPTPAVFRFRLRARR